MSRKKEKAEGSNMFQKMYHIHLHTQEFTSRYEYTWLKHKIFYEKATKIFV
jgi:hypothetical protein